MPWRDQMGAAKFRGVPFYVENAGREGGRRGVTHEYPKRNDPYREDLGREGRSFQVEGYVVGPEYIAARDALWAALESDDGPGELEHPAYYGTRRCAVGKVSTRETRDRGGTCVFSIEFIETPTQAVAPVSIPDAPAKVKATKIVAIESITAGFLGEYSPGVHVASLEGVVRAASLSINNVLEVATLETQALAGLKRQVDHLSSSAATLVESPQDLLDDVLAVFESIGEAFTAQSDGSTGRLSAEDAGRVLCLAAYNFDPGVRPPATTANRLIEQTNFDAIRHLVQRAALIQAAVFASDQTWVSYDEAVAARDAIAGLLDDQAETAADDTYPSLMQLRADLVRAVPGDSSDLARIVAYTPAFAMPSLVLAQRLYGSLERESDIIERNGVEHPCFVRGELKVLSDG